MTEELCIHELLPDECSACRPLKPKWRAVKPLKPTTAPKTADDPIAPLGGTKDISIPMHATEPYLGTDWLVTQGYPSDLRPGGWVYLRVDEKLAARARAVAMRWRDDRPWRTGDEPGTFGPGLVFAVDPETWEPFDQDLGEEAERMRQGYRYHLTDRSGRVHHFMVGDPIANGDWDV